MLIQKIKIIVPNEVNEVVYTEKEEDFIRINWDELNRLKRKIIIYKTFDLDCKENNFFNLYITLIFLFIFFYKYNINDN